MLTNCNCLSSFLAKMINQQHISLFAEAEITVNTAYLQTIFEENSRNLFEIGNLRGEIGNLRVQNVDLDHRLRNANFELMRQRGMVEPRQVIDHIERFTLNEWGIQGNTRMQKFTNLYNNPSFFAHHNTINSPRIRTTNNKSYHFAKIVQEIYEDKSVTIHSLAANCVLLPASLGPDKIAVLHTLCNIIPVNYRDV